jgi:hypothetical protein
MSTYQFDATKGAGVPGLPHVITDEEAAALGVNDLLMAAIENGSYVEKTNLTPSPSPSGEGKKKQNKE